MTALVQLKGRVYVGVLCACIALLLLSPPAHADGDDFATVSLGVGMVHTTAPGQTAEKITDANFSLRAKVFYIFGIDLAVAAGSSDFTGGMPSPRFRLTTMVYLINTQAFGLFGAAGLSSATIGDLFSIHGGTTYGRVGGGTEVTVAGHWSADVAGYWVVPGIGLVNRSLNQSLQDSGALPEFDVAMPTNGWEIVTGVRYYF